MKKIILIVVLSSILFSSCQYFEKEVPSNEKLLEKELKLVNWKKVDEFPSVVECEKIKDEVVRNQCFFEFLTQTIKQKLSVDTLLLPFPEGDTIQVKVTVFADASLKLEPQFSTKISSDAAVKIDSLLQACLIDFPKVNPAIKRGLPVKTQFILPVVLVKK